jgi:preprotein translocase subunit YajC
VDIKVSKDNVVLKIVVFILLYLILGGRIYCIRRSQRRKEQYQRNLSNIMNGELQENVAVRY